MIYLLFGEMGIGKNYVGERLAKHLKCQFFDGDDVLPQHLKEKVNKVRSLSSKEVDDFVTNYLIPGIEFSYDGKDLVVAQALYMRRHRQEIVDKFKDVELVYIPALWFLAHMKRLYGRKRGFRWMLLGLLSKPFFQEPKKDVTAIFNHIDINLSSQFHHFMR